MMLETTDGEDVGRVKTIVILGAGISQVPLIRAAKRLGLRAVVASRRGNYPGFAEADRAYFVDTTDIEGIVEVARQERAQGICTTGTDVAVRALGAAADRLGLPGVSGEAASLCSDKLRMKRTFMEHGVKTARYIAVRDRQEAFDAFRRLQPPLIFKAVDSGASKGIIRVDRPDQIEYACAAVRQATRQPYFIVEEFVEGLEFGAQAFVYNGKVQFVMPHGDMMFYGDAGVPIGHYVPFDLPAELLEEVRRTTRRSVEALRLDQCAVNADFILKEGEVYVLEIGARAGATCLPELVSAHYGFDYYEQMIRAAIGLAPNFTALRAKPCACELILSPEGGTLADMRYDGEPDPDVLDVSFDGRPGDPVSAFRVGTDRIGQIIVQGERIEEVWQRLERVKSGIRVTVENGRDDR